MKFWEIIRLLDDGCNHGLGEDLCKQCRKEIAKWIKQTFARKNK